MCKICQNPNPQRKTWLVIASKLCHKLETSQANQPQNSSKNHFFHLGWHRSEMPSIHCSKDSHSNFVEISINIYFLTQNIAKAIHHLLRWQPWPSAVRCLWLRADTEEGQSDKENAYKQTTWNKEFGSKRNREQKILSEKKKYSFISNSATVGQSSNTRWTLLLRPEETREKWEEDKAHT